MESLCLSLDDHGIHWNLPPEFEIGGISLILVSMLQLGFTLVILVLVLVLIGCPIMVFLGF